MSIEVKKPQKPIEQEGVYVYPKTVMSQVKMDNDTTKDLGTELNKKVAKNELLSLSQISAASAATLADKAPSAEAVKQVNESLTELNSKVGSYNDSIQVDSVIAAIESSFQNTANYNNCIGYTQAGVEGGWFGFKHNSNKNFYFTFYTAYYGILGGKRNADGTYEFKRIMA